MGSNPRRATVATGASPRPRVSVPAEGARPSAMLRSAVGARRHGRDRSPERRASRIVRPNSGKRPPARRHRLSLRAQMALGCACSPQGARPRSKVPPPPTADRGHFSLPTAAVPWDCRRLTATAVRGSYHRSRARCEVAHARDAAAPTEATSIIDGGGTGRPTTDIEGPTRGSGGGPDQSRGADRLRSGPSPTLPRVYL
jgi:hypothetical protein